MRQTLKSPLHLCLATFAAAIMTAAPVISGASMALAAGPAIEAPGEVLIFSTTDGATVEIDGKVVGVLPMEDGLLLLPGQHTIKVHLRGWTEYVDTFEITSGDEVELEIDLIPYAGIVRINTREPGATVTVDGKIEGVTPFDKDITVGDKLFTLTRPGYEDMTRKMLIRAGEEYTLDLELVALPDQVSGDKKFYQTWWFWTIVGVGAAGAATAAAVGSSGGTPNQPTSAFTLQIP